MLPAVAFATTNKTDPPPSPLPLPPRGWSTWNTFTCAINATLVHDSIHALANSKLFLSGYNWVLIDDCWTKCNKFNHDGSCSESGDRDEQGRIIIDSKKFPDGFKPLTDLAHSKGLKIGIYTSVSAITCGGFTGSFQHEAVDAATFAEWGFDMVKHDTCGTDYSVHDGGMQAAVSRMRDGIWEAGKGKLVYYLDSGNPTSPMRVFNPHQRGITSKEGLLKCAVKPEELVWRWATEWDDDLPKGPHMFKSWFDSQDTWGNMLSISDNQKRNTEYQKCGQFNNPDMLTIGQGQQTHEQYRAQFFLWAVMGAPLIMGNDIRSFDDTFLIDLVTSPEILKMNLDPDCVQASMARALGATETWIRPLVDGSFAVVLLNKGDKETTCKVFLNDADQGWGAGSDFFPADFDKMSVRDIYAQKDLGTFHSKFEHKVGAQDGAIFIMTPQ